MGYTVGLDMGSSTIKIVFMEKERLADCVRIDRSESYEEVLIKKGLENIEKIVTVGAGSSFIEGDILGIKTSHVEEFEAIARGGQYLSGEEECLVVSLGTGTCFIYAGKDSITHAGGCGIGGALLSSLADYGLGMKDVNEFTRLALDGSASNADLQIKDISKNDIDTLYGDVTVANMAKINKESAPCDYAYGVCNLVFQNIGVMAYMASKAFLTSKIVVLGTMASGTFAKDSFAAVGGLFKVDFIVPENSAYAVAIGAVLLDKT